VGSHPKHFSFFFFGFCGGLFYLLENCVRKLQQYKEDLDEYY